ncbi:hypothetical protein EJ03DRAFT_171402 [Teratosphaeria nubilosa]|uniref:Uncharacterized protein n=1 Tax=Teratosphaeria nubilosa TaxID=161662 RepID=A0A6G1LK73_9PEZI|nr:hypothetical protein EJ03DRAFT_171402 [Teratosphaeria nubilosa]
MGHQSSHTPFFLFRGLHPHARGLLPRHNHVALLLLPFAYAGSRVFARAIPPRKASQIASLRWATRSTVRPPYSFARWSVLNPRLTNSWSFVRALRRPSGIRRLHTSFTARQQWILSVVCVCTNEAQQSGSGAGTSVFDRSTASANSTTCIPTVSIDCRLRRPRSQQHARPSALADTTPPTSLSPATTWLQPRITNLPESSLALLRLKYLGRFH